MVNNQMVILNQVFSALSDPTRRGILQKLTAKPVSATVLAKPYHMSLPAVSKHLRLLEAVGLIERQVIGRHHYFRLKPARMKTAMEWMEQYRKFWSGRLDALATFIEDN